MTAPKPTPGAVYYVGQKCGVPHGFRPIWFRVISVDPRPTYPGMAWLEGYELGTDGRAVERRRIYVIADGLIPMPERRIAAQPARPGRWGNAGPARIPRPRTSPETSTGRTR
jgi:hypothetical protein